MMMLKEDDLEHLLLELQNNSLVLEQIYEKMYNEVYRYIYSIVRIKEYAQDLTHDVFIHIYQNIHLYKGNGHAKAWILTISRNITYMSLRKTNREYVVDYEISKIDESMNGIHNKLLINTLMLSLHSEEREIIVLHAVEGMTFKDISQIMDLKLSTVLNRYHRSLKKMKKSLEE